MSSIKIYSPSVRYHFFNEMSKTVNPYECVFIDGRNPKCLSNLFNNIISKADNDIVIIANDKARPSSADVDKIVNLINNGYGFVALYRLGFFGIHKSVIKKIGWFDERCVTAGYEDNDIFIRLHMGNIASYITEEIKYISNIPTLWNHNLSGEWFYTKYKFDSNASVIYKYFPEENYSYELKINNDLEIKDWSYSYLPDSAFWAYGGMHTAFFKYAIIDKSGEV